MTATRRRYLLIADDFGMSEGISAGIARLCRAGRLSGTSAMVAAPGWPAAAAEARALRAVAAIGLHLNLTAGTPLGPMPAQAPDGRLPPVSVWMRLALTGRVAIDEVEAEIERQLDAFEAATGAAPDHVDGHHHVHAFPGVRDALARSLHRRYPAMRLPLVRLPGDRAARIITRRACLPKALLLTALSAGAGARFRAIGAPVNDGFSGVSHFRPGASYAAELARFERNPGPAHLVMCHPGHAAPADAALDPVSCRRDEEFAALLADPTLPERIRHPARHRDAGGFIDWGAALAD